MSKCDARPTRVHTLRPRDGLQRGETATARAHPFLTASTCRDHSPNHLPTPCLSRNATILLHFTGPPVPITCQ
eukprot:119711-Prorocentrum_minimum.AAC.1